MIMLKIGVSQIKNSTNFEENFSTIHRALGLFENSDVDLILFPECSLSGFSSKIQECTYQVIKEYLDQIEKWSERNNKFVILPTALKNDSIFNTGYVFGDGQSQQFYKLGLTESEQNFFSVPKESTKKVFEIKGYKVAILICFEAQMESWKFFKDGEVDVILWPGYWGWEKGDTWQEFNKEGEPNLIFKNMKKWRRPLIQSNFSYNDLADHRDSGPHGLSMFVNSDNTLFGNGEYDYESCYKICIKDSKIKSFEKIGDL